MADGDAGLYFSRMLARVRERWEVAVAGGAVAATADAAAREREADVCGSRAGGGRCGGTGEADDRRRDLLQRRQRRDRGGSARQGGWRPTISQRAALREYEGAGAAAFNRSSRRSWRCASWPSACATPTSTRCSRWRRPTASCRSCGRPRASIAIAISSSRCCAISRPAGRCSAGSPAQCDEGRPAGRRPITNRSARLNDRINSAAARCSA